MDTGHDTLARRGGHAWILGGSVLLRPEGAIAASRLQGLLQVCGYAIELTLGEETAAFGVSSRGISSAANEADASAGLVVYLGGGGEQVGVPIEIEGRCLGQWWRDEGGKWVAVQIRETARAVEVVIEGLAAAGSDPRVPGRFSAIAPDEERLRTYLPEGSTLYSGLPGEWWVQAPEECLKGQSPWVDASLLPPEVAVGRRLKSRGICLALAESCTGGELAGRLTSIPGSSAYVERGWVVYTNEAKQELLGVSNVTLQAYGAVSQEVAVELAHGALERSQADLGIAVTGIAGPTGGGVQKPVGTVCFGIAKRGGRIWRWGHRFAGDRNTVRWHSVNAALAGILEAIDEGEANWVEATDRPIR